MDIITRYSNAQAVTTAVVSDVVNTFGSDAARNVFMRRPNLLKILVATTFAGLDSGIRIEFRFDTQADLASGSQIVLAASAIILPAKLVALDLYQIPIAPRKLESGYDFCGAYYVPVSEAASGGAFTTWLADGAESADAPDA